MVAMKTNVGGTLNLLEAARLAGGVDRFLLFSTIGVIGQVLYEPIDANHPLVHGARRAARRLQRRQGCCRGVLLLLHAALRSRHPDRPAVGPVRLRHELVRAELHEEHRRAGARGRARPARDRRAGPPRLHACRRPRLARRLRSSKARTTPTGSSTVRPACRCGPPRTSGRSSESSFPDALVEIGDEWTEIDRDELPIRGRYSIENARARATAGSPVSPTFVTASRTTSPATVRSSTSGGEPTRQPEGLRGRPGERHERAPREPPSPGHRRRQRNQDAPSPCRLLQDGARVAALDIEPATLEALAQEAASDRLRVFTADVTDETMLAAAVRRARGRVGRPRHRRRECRHRADRPGRRTGEARRRRPSAGGGRQSRRDGPDLQAGPPRDGPLGRRGRLHGFADRPLRASHRRRRLTASPRAE